MQNNFKPYVPAEEITPEFTVTSVVSGVLLAIVFGAANAYLGLRVGMTISASIPAAVIAMGITRIVLRRNSVLESNMVQTIGSAGESLAAGCIFTLPVLFLWAKEGLIEEPSLLSISLIAIVGGILGVLFMIPLRNSIIVQEHGTLPYPEAQACTEVLLAGEKSGSGAKTIFLGMGFSALLKFIIDGLKLVPAVIEIPIAKFKTLFATELYPAVVGVGYICGFRISSFLFAGGILAWFVMIPLIVIFGGDSVLFPADVSVKELYETGGAGAIWSKFIRYIGAGALAAAGIISLAKSLPTIFRTFSAAMKGLKSSSNGAKTENRTEKDLDTRIVIFGSLAILVITLILPPIQVGIIGVLLIAVFGFFFATVSSRMVGLVGSSNNPASGMTIATLLFATLILKLTGNSDTNGMVSAITVGGIICIVVCLAGDMSQDLKTGYLLGATPKKQQIGELIGSVVSALSIGGVLVLLNKAWGFGSAELSAPQATLMKIVTEGVMEGSLPWEFILVGIACTVVFEVLHLPSLAIAIGIYLPLELSVPIMIGGVIRWFMDKRNKSETKESSNGVLFSSGLIAGEGIVGIILAILTVCGAAEKIDLSAHSLGIVGGIVALAVLVAGIVSSALPKKNEA